ncbi:MAG: NAD-dependent epimerase/dehydratase family protein [Patescibacteria group bacterium]
MERLTGKNILVTGGTGFVGSHLVEALLDGGARVVVPYRSLDPFSYFATQKLGDRVIMAIGDLKDFNRIFDIIVKYEIEYIFHLAAQAIVTTAYHDPLETIAANVLGTTHVLEAARRYPGIKGVLVASSDKAYGKSSRAYREDDPLRGDHPYEASKAAADLIALAYFKTYNLPVVVTRFGNIYGPGDLNFNRIIPGIMKTLNTGETLVLRSDGTYKRDYVYVKDVVSGYLFLLEKIDKTKGEAFNLSSDDNLSVIDLIKKAEKVLAKKIPYKIANTAINEIPYQHLEYSKIRKLGWRPRFNLSLGLHETYGWYKKTLALVQGGKHEKNN